VLRIFVQIHKHLLSTYSAFTLLIGRFENYHIYPAILRGKSGKLGACIYQHEVTKLFKRRVDQSPSLQGPTPKEVRLDKWKLKFDGSDRGMAVESILFRVDQFQEMYGLNGQQVFREFHILLTGAATEWNW